MKAKIIAALVAATTTLNAQPPPTMVSMGRAELTAYCSCAKCCGDFPGKVRGQTASGNMAAPGTIAAPKGIPFGTAIDFAPDGQEFFTRLGIVQDRGGAIKAKPDGTIRLDVWMPNHQTALKFGRKSGIIRFEPALAGGKP